jgi:hypothetical protein
MSTPLFGRAWNIQVLTPPGNAGTQTLLQVSSSDRETQSLRVIFDIQQLVGPELWYAEVTVYNPNLQTIQTLTDGCTVSIAAGYQSEGTPAEIFRGILYQAIFGKEDAHTVFLKMRCFVGLPELTDTYIKAIVGPKATQREIVLAMAANCLKADGTPAPLPVAYLAPDSDFTRGSLPRSQTIFGAPSRLFGNVAEANGMSYFFGSDGIHLGRVDGSAKATPDVIYAPPISAGSNQKEEAGVRYCLIGTPQQTQFGVDFRVLLDARLNARLPCMQAQLKNAVIEQAPFLRGVFQTALTQDGVYFVGAVRHIGDTRGQNWESQVTAFTSVAGVSSLLGGDN